MSEGVPPSRTTRGRRAWEVQRRLKAPALEWARRAIRNSRHRSKGRFAHSITKERLLDLLDEQKGLCYYCGKAMPLSFFGVKFHPDSPSVDRVRQDIGYVEDNVVVCCIRCNELKADAFLHELSRIVEGMTKFFLRKNGGH